MEVVLRIAHKNRLGLLIQVCTEIRWTGLYRFLLANGRSGEVPIWIRGRKLAPGAELRCNAGPLRWSYRISPAILAGNSGYVVLGDIALLPIPWPDGLPVVRLEGGRGVLVPAASESARWASRLIFWGKYEPFGNLRVVPRLPPPLRSQRDSIRRIETYFSVLFGFHPFPDALHFLFPILPAAGRGGFRGAGLASAAATILFLPMDYHQMDPAGFLWLAAHEIAHLWIGVAIHASADLLWLVEGLAAYYALLAVCHLGGAREDWIRKIIKNSWGARQEPMHRGFLTALDLDAMLKGRGHGGLHSSISALLRECWQCQRPLTFDDFTRAACG